MALNRLIVNLIFIALVDAFVAERDGNTNFNTSDEFKSDLIVLEEKSEDPSNAFNGVYSECLLHMSYTCLQKKTLQYLKELDGLSEVSVIGDYVKFIKLNITDGREDNGEEQTSTKTSDELSHMIDKAVDTFFDNHLIRFSALGKDVFMPHAAEEFVGRKRRKGGGGGGGHGGGDDGGKKKMMMMAMMCMKMKLMMMVPAMMGMMGMMSFKGMMFSMMTFMISKMMLLMKILEKKAGGGGGGGVNDSGWAASGGGGAWMPAGGQDYGGGGGYDSNAQWSSRSILEKEDKLRRKEKTTATNVKPAIRYNTIHDSNLSLLKNINDEVIKAGNKNDGQKSRRKRGLMDTIQNAYFYWTSKVLGLSGYKQKHSNYPKFKIINGVKYIYYPLRPLHKFKAPKELPIATNSVKPNEGSKPIVIPEDFNKGEIVEGVIESRMNRKKFHKMKDNVSETVDNNPWE